MGKYNLRKEGERQSSGEFTEDNGIYIMNTRLEKREIAINT